MSEREQPEGEHKGWAVEIGTRLFNTLYVRPLNPRTLAFVWDTMSPDIINGRTRSYYADCVFLLRTLEKDISGLENIPESRHVLLTANHPRFDLYNGYSSDFAFGLVGQDKELRLIMQEGLTYKGHKIPLTDIVHRAQAQTYGHILVTPPDIRQNGKQTTEGNSALKISRLYKNGERIGLFPEATSQGLAMREGNPLAGALALVLAKVQKDGVVCPVGIYIKDGVLNVRVEEPYGISELSGLSAQEASNYMLAKVNLLLPSEYQNPSFGNL